MNSSPEGEKGYLRNWETSLREDFISLASLPTLMLVKQKCNGWRVIFAEVKYPPIDWFIFTDFEWIWSTVGRMVEVVVCLSLIIFTELITGNVAGPRRCHSRTGTHQTNCPSLTSKSSSSRSQSTHTYWPALWIGGRPPPFCGTKCDTFC